MSDPGLAGDNQVYAEAITGDGGVHNASAIWWLSPDIQLDGNAPTVNPGDTITVHAKAHHRGGLPNATLVQFEMWICTTSVAITSATATRISPNNLTLDIFSFSGGVGTRDYTWAVPASLPNTNPEGLGHRCLVGRYYPLLAGVTPSTSSFYLPDEPHACQHNIDIVPAGGAPMKKGLGTWDAPLGTVDGLWSFSLQTGAVGERNEQVVIRVGLDPAPHVHVRNALRPLLKGRPVEAISDSRVPGVKMHLGELDADIREVEYEEGRGPDRPDPHRPSLPHPVLEARTVLPHGKPAFVHLQVDPKTVPVGQAKIFHVWQEGERSGAQGGVTVVFAHVGD
jgi:hypothetical protein